MAELPDPPPLKLADLREILIRQEETIIFALIERAQFAVNAAIYAAASDPQSRALTQAFLSNGGTDSKSFLDFMLLETERLHSLVRRYTAPDEHAFFPQMLPPPAIPKINLGAPIKANRININAKIKSVYINEILGRLATSGVDDDEQYGSSAVTDIAVLQALSKRIHFGKFIAEAKFQANREHYSALIRAGNSEGLMQELTKPAVEVAVLERVRVKASTYGQDPQRVATQGADQVTAFKVDPMLIMALYRDWVMPLTKEVQIAYLLQRLDAPTVAFVGYTDTAHKPLPFDNTGIIIRHLVEPPTDGADLSTTEFQYVPYTDAVSVIDAVKLGDAQMGMIAFESSDVGVHPTAQRALIESELFITREWWRDISNSLMCPVGCTWPPKGERWQVYGTRVSLMRTDMWIRATMPPGTQRVEVDSDTDAIDAVTKAAGMAVALVLDWGITTELPQGFKRLPVDVPAARERIVSVEKAFGEPSGKDATTLVFTIPGKSPGELLSVLQAFREYNVNLSQIQSLPTPSLDGGYYFYVVLDGHVKDDRVSSALEVLEKLTDEIRILGSYMKTGPGVATAPEPSPRAVSVKPAAAIDADQATTIGFLGPAATYSHQAALNVFGSSVNYKPFGSIDDVFKGVEQGECSKAIIPIENSIAGFVLDSLHMMNACEISVVQMMYLPINHCLISQSPLDQIKEVHSKDQALAQCKGWLEEHLPGVTQVGRSSTSQAVELSQRRTEVAAIASSLASQRYKIPIVTANIQDDSANVTKFLVIAPKDEESDFVDDGKYLSTFVFTLKDGAEGLPAALGLFSAKQIKIRKCESVPNRWTPWAKVYFVECGGHIKHEAVAECFAGLQHLSIKAKCIGSYEEVSPPF